MTLSSSPGESKGQKERKPSWASIIRLGIGYGMVLGGYCAAMVTGEWVQAGVCASGFLIAAAILYRAPSSSVPSTGGEL